MKFINVWYLSESRGDLYCSVTVLLKRGFTLSVCFVASHNFYIIFSNKNEIGPKRGSTIRIKINRKKCFDWQNVQNDLKLKYFQNVIKILTDFLLNQLSNLLVKF